MRSSQAFSAGKSSSEISHQPAAAIQPQCAMSAERQRRVISGLSIIDVCLWLGAGARIWGGGGAQGSQITTTTPPSPVKNALGKRDRANANANTTYQQSCTFRP